MNYALLEGLVEWRQSILQLEDVFFWHALSTNGAAGPEPRPQALLSDDGQGGLGEAADTQFEFIVTEILSFDQAGDVGLPDLIKYERLLKRYLDGKVYFSNDVQILAHNYMKSEPAPQYGGNSVVMSWRGVASTRPREVSV